MNMSQDVSMDSPRTVTGRVHGESAPSRTQTETERSTSTSPEYGTRESTREDRTTRERIRQISYADALTRVVSHLRPDWDLTDIRRQVLRDPRPDAIASAAAVFAAVDRDMRHPGSIGAYQPPTHKPEPRVDFPRAPKCPHGVLADPDGRGAGCESCGTRAVPMPAGLRREVAG